ncbi:odorant receptor 4-like isoform X2 [Linepithema humile]|uniref:odorant receptor 4-like isoform X2 n=1 Tax=Linepithema humile TaxID=83485 RepID=UPI00351DE0AF
MKATGTISRPIEILLRIFGLWPGSLHTSFYWIISLVVILIFQYRYIIKNLHSIDLAELMDDMSVIMAYLLLFIKLIIFWFNQRTLNRILAMIVMDWKNIDTDFNASTVASKATLSDYLSKFIIGFHALTATVYSAAIFIIGFFNDKISEESTRPLIIKMDLPFDSDKRLVYEIVMFSQFLHLLLCACLDGTLNALLIALILHVSDQIDILCGWLLEIFPKKEKSAQSTTKKVITTHQKIIVFSKNIENLYSFVMMVQLLSITLITCSLGVILVASIGTPNALSKAIADAAYNSLWYESNSKDNQIILFLIMRSQNQLTLKVGRFMDLTLSRFSDIIKASASYVSVLLAMY